MSTWSSVVARAMTVAGGGVAIHAAVLAGQQPPTLCGGAPESRWSSAGATYRQTSVAGNTPATELESITGLAAIAGRVFVHDGRGTRVHILNDQLEPVTRFGRFGQGPGELTVLALLAFDPVGHFTTNTLAADDSLVYVYDGRRLQQYRHDGTYARGSAPGQVLAREQGIRTLQPRPEGIYIGYDSIDFATGFRQLLTWRVNASGRTRIHAADLPRLPVRNGRVPGHSRDARPLWTLAGDCVVWSDGFNHRMVRTRLSDGVTDTITLPRHTVPPDDYNHADATRLARSMGSPAPPRRPQDTPLWHWAGLIVDPDGHVWVRPWTRLGQMEGPVYRVDVRGRVHAEPVPAFPEAFGPAGVFYARDRKWQTDEILLVRYQKGG